MQEAILRLKIKLGPLDGLTMLKKEVRRQEVLGSKRKSGDTILKKGTTFQRIGGENLGYTKGVFASYKISDKDLYKGVLGRMRISYLAKTNQDVSLNELKLTTKKILECHHPKQPKTHSTNGMEHIKKKRIK